MTRNDAMYYDILTEYSTPGGDPFNWKIGNKTLTEAGFSQGQAQSAFQYFWARWQAIGRNITQFMDLTCMTAAISDAIWSGHAAAYTATCQSRVNVRIPAGRYQINYPLPLAFGIYTGAGSSEFFTNGADYGGTFGQGSTSLHLDIARWQGSMDDGIWQSGTWGDENLFGYNEAFQLLNMRLVGNKESNVYDPTKLRCGVQVWDMGSNAFIHNVFADDFEAAGFHFVRGTYANCGQVASFNNNLCAFWLEGGGQHNFNSIESDECPATFRVEGGYGRVGSTSFHCSWYKSETGPAPNRPIGKGTMVMDAQGWVQASFGTVQYAAVNGAPHCMFRVNADFNNTGTLSNSCQVHVEMLNLFGPCYGLFHDVFNRKLWLNDALSGQFNQNGYFRTRVKDFRWTSELGGALVSTFYQPVLGSVNMAPGRLATLPIDPQTGNFIGSWDNEAGTPAYTIAPPAGEGSVPPPPPPPPPTNVPTNITVTLQPSTVTLGQTSQASVQVLNQFGQPMTPAGTYSIVGGSASITQGGVVTALAAGGITVQYSQGAVSGTALLTANNPAPAPSTPTTVEVTLASSSVPEGGTVQATAVVRDQNGQPMSASGTWSIVSGPATVNSTGLVTTTTAGTVIVRYTVNAIFGNATLLVQNVQPPPPPGPTPLYSIDFTGKNVLALPGCAPLSGQPWKAGTITGDTFSTVFAGRAINTEQRLTPSIQGVRRIVLKNAVVRERTQFRWLNDVVRTNGVGQFVLASNQSTVVGSYGLNVAATDITITLPSATTITSLVGGVNQYNTLNFTCEGIELWAN